MELPSSETLTRCVSTGLTILRGREKQLLCSTLQHAVEWLRWEFSDCMTL